MGEVRSNGNGQKGGAKVKTSAVTFAIQSFVTLFVILDPPGVAPVFISLIKGKSAKESRKLAVQAAGVSLLVITVFALFGRFILNYLNISISAMQAAGGLLLLLVSLQLLTGQGKEELDLKDSSVALVPLGTPLLAGPGAIVATMIFVQQVHDVAHGVGLAVVVLAVHVAIALSLVAASPIVRIIKDAGVTLVARIAGLLLAAIAVQMVVTAIRGFIAAG